MNRDWSKEVDKKFGSLTIVEILPYSQPGDGTLCRAICDCSSVVIAPIKRIVYGRKTSCGCYKGVDLLGQTFGRLTVIRKLDTRYHRQICWECRCECGNVATVPSDSLRRGMTRSCGCLGNETKARNCKSALTKRMVMGTNLAMISRSDDQPMAHNTSGYTGVSYNRNRDKYESCLIFQGDKYCSRHNTLAEAVAARKEMKQIHQDFIDEYYSENE